ncbi:MAG: chorismate mutase [Microbacteriaceae bacterium]|nr:chorismate mutase [Microbacteriaceae bacterium]
MATNENPATSVDVDVLDQLHSVRESIDNIDAALVHLLAERFKFTQQVGKLKATHGLPPADPAREAEQIQRLRALAVESHLDPAFAEKFLNFIIAEVIHHHERLAGSAGAGAATGAATGAGAGVAAAGSSGSGSADAPGDS